MVDDSENAPCKTRERVFDGVPSATSMCLLTAHRTRSTAPPTGTHLHVIISRRGAPQTVVRGGKRGERDGLACCEESCWRDGEHGASGGREGGESTHGCSPL